MAAAHKAAQGPLRFLRGFTNSPWTRANYAHHEILMNADGFDDALPVPAFGPRIVCTCCGIVGAYARRNWKERSEQKSLTGVHWR
jgi:hypothetical protein